MFAFSCSLVMRCAHPSTALGAKVTAQYNTNRGPLAALVPPQAGQLWFTQANLTHEQDVRNLFDLNPPSESISGFGPVQVLVVNHGIWPTSDIPIASMSLDQWKSTLDTNLTSSFLAVREYMLWLRKASDKLKEKSSIVLIGSTAGKYGEAGHADYAASKSGESD
jgi:NAD(P)-dependent dehydrogenase (short-subunit alcohol dehydrogenase family)